MEKSLILFVNRFEVSLTIHGGVMEGANHVRLESLADLTCHVANIGTFRAADLRLDHLQIFLHLQHIEE